MSDVIRLLPDNVANQIAAGEVVQRPASAVKELLENSIDSGALNINLLVKDAGKSLIQVIDDGKGMSETDARMAFERHATSKITKAEDIFAIVTKGFRGEALASIAAVAQVQLKTKVAQQELGTQLQINGSKLVEQDYCQCPAGTQIEIKNLFFNIPARRNFLKSNNVELRHIIDEFQRVALAHPGIRFTFDNNGSELFDLASSNLRQRIVHIFGNKYNAKLVPVEEETPILKLTGFVGKPEFAKKTRGEQFFFANHRFIKNHYLHRAVCLAFDGLISEGWHPSYFLYLEIDPAKIDVNIHPTKTEIKFEDERAIHTIIRTAVKHALGQYNIAPTLDFESQVDFIQPLAKGQTVSPPTIDINPNFNPFDSDNSAPKSAKFGSNFPVSKAANDWEKMFEGLPEIGEHEEQQQDLEIDEEANQRKSYSQIGRKYILTKLGSGIVLIHQQRAHERILFEKIMQSFENKNVPSQQLLFPQNISFNPADFETLKNMLTDLRNIGFDLDEFGKNELIVHGVPLFFDSNALGHALEQLLEEEKNHSHQLNNLGAQGIAKTLAKATGLKIGSQLSPEEIHHLVDELFACEQAYLSLNGKPIVVNLSLNDIDKNFN